MKEVKGILDNPKSLILGCSVFMPNLVRNKIWIPAQS